MRDKEHTMMEEDGHWHHTGKQDRRNDQRRGKDRREMIRFEIDKEDRRKGKDRRGKATDWGSDKPL